MPSLQRTVAPFVRPFLACAVVGATLWGATSAGATRSDQPITQFEEAQIVGSAAGADLTRTGSSTTMPASPPTTTPDSPPTVTASGSVVTLPCTASVEYETFLRNSALEGTTPYPGDASSARNPCSSRPTYNRDCQTFETAVPGSFPGSACGAGPALANGPARTTWKFPVTTKLFIAHFGPAKCGTPGVKDPTLLKSNPVYVAFCGAAAAINDKPTKPEKTDPLDARIWARYDFELTCEANKPVPVAGKVTSGGTAGGREPGGFQGVINEPKIRDQITVDGGFGLVTSGHPHPKLEPSFSTAAGERKHTDIFNKISGTVTCVDTPTGPEARFAAGLYATGFPSHKVWLGDDLYLEAEQGTFSVLWALPAIPDA